MVGAPHPGQLDEDEGVGGVGEGEERERQERAAQGRRQPSRLAERGRRRDRSGRLAGQGEGDHRQHARDGGPEEDGAELLAAGRLAAAGAEQPEQAGAEERPERGPGVVHGAVEAEGTGPDGGGGRAGDERVARGGADPLAHPVDEPHRQHVPGSGREGHERPGDGGEAVAGEHQRLEAGAPVREQADQVLEEAGDQLAGALDQADEGVGGAQHRQEGRQQREDRLARGVGEQADQPEADDGARQLLLRREGPTPLRLPVPPVHAGHRASRRRLACPGIACSRPPDLIRAPSWMSAVWRYRAAHQG